MTAYDLIWLGLLTLTTAVSYLIWGLVRWLCKLRRPAEVVKPQPYPNTGRTGDISDPQMGELHWNFTTAELEAMQERHRG